MSHESSGFVFPTLNLTIDLWLWAGLAQSVLIVGMAVMILMAV